MYTHVLQVTNNAPFFCCAGIMLKASWGRIKSKCARKNITTAIGYFKTKIFKILKMTKHFKD